MPISEKLRSLDRTLKAAKAELEDAQRAENWQRAGELTYTIIPELEKKLNAQREEEKSEIEQEYEQLEIVAGEIKPRLFYKPERPYTLRVVILLSQLQSEIIDRADLYETMYWLPSGVGIVRCPLKLLFDLPGHRRLHSFYADYETEDERDRDRRTIRSSMADLRWDLVVHLRKMAVVIKEEPQSSGPPPDRAETVEDVINSRRRARRDRDEC